MGFLLLIIVFILWFILFTIQPGNLTPVNFRKWCIKCNKVMRKYDKKCDSCGYEMTKQEFDHGLNIIKYNIPGSLSQAIIDKDYDAINFILKYIPVNVYEKGNTFQNTPLHYACRLGDIDLIKTLIKIGFKIYEKNKDGLTPVDIAIKFHNIDITEFRDSYGEVERIKK